MCPWHQEEDEDLPETRPGDDNDDSPVPAFNLSNVKWPAAIATLCLGCFTPVLFQYCCILISFKRFESKHEKPVSDQ